MRQVGHLPEIYRDARSTERKKKSIFLFLASYAPSQFSVHQNAGHQIIFPTYAVPSPEVPIRRPRLKLLPMFNAVSLTMAHNRTAQKPVVRFVLLTPRLVSITQAADTYGFGSTVISTYLNVL
jgi:hypothetical protein